MKIVYTRAVTKDVQNIKDEILRGWIRQILDDLKKAEKLQQISGIKKMKGHPSAFRIRIGDYRLGVLHENDTVILLRCLKRSDIYKVFP